MFKSSHKAMKLKIHECMRTGTRREEDRRERRGEEEKRGEEERKRGNINIIFVYLMILFIKNCQTRSQSVPYQGTTSATGLPLLLAAPHLLQQMVSFFI